MTRFVEDPHFRSALMRSAGVRDVLDDRCQAAAAVAVRLAPDDPETSGEDLHSSVFGEVGMTSRGWVGRVGAANFKAPWFEEGATGVPARPFLRPAVEAEIGPIEAADGMEEQVAEIPDLVDVETVVLAHLAGDVELGPLVGGVGDPARVGAELPAGFPAAGESFVQAFRATSSDAGSGHLERAVLQVNGYGASRAEAFDVIRVALRALHRAPAAAHDASVITAVERLTGPTWSPDPRTDASRYTMTVAITAHPVPAG